MTRIAPVRIVSKTTKQLSASDVLIDTWRNHWTTQVRAFPSQRQFQPPSKDGKLPIALGTHHLSHLLQLSHLPPLGPLRFSQTTVPDLHVANPCDLCSVCLGTNWVCVPRSLHQLGQRPWPSKATSCQLGNVHRHLCCSPLRSSEFTPHILPALLRTFWIFWLSHVLHPVILQDLLVIQRFLLHDFGFEAILDNSCTSSDLVGSAPLLANMMTSKSLLASLGMIPTLLVASFRLLNFAPS